MTDKDKEFEAALEYHNAHLIEKYHDIFERGALWGRSFTLKEAREELETYQSLSREYNGKRLKVERQFADKDKLIEEMAKYAGNFPPPFKVMEWTVEALALYEKSKEGK